jgi:hypothetical protein
MRFKNVEISTNILYAVSLILWNTTHLPAVTFHFDLPAVTFLRLFCGTLLKYQRFRWSNKKITFRRLPFIFHLPAVTLFHLHAVTFSILMTFQRLPFCFLSPSGGYLSYPLRSENHVEIGLIIRTPSYDLPAVTFFGLLMYKNDWNINIYSTKLIHRPVVTLLPSGGYLPAFTWLPLHLLEVTLLPSTGYLLSSVAFATTGIEGSLLYITIPYNTKTIRRVFICKVYF